MRPSSNLREAKSFSEWTKGLMIPNVELLVP